MPVTLSERINVNEMQDSQRYLVRVVVYHRGDEKTYEFVDVFRGYAWKDDLEEIRYAFWNEHPATPTGDILEVWTAKWKGRE